MPLAIASLTSGVNGGAAAGSFTTADISPADNALVLCFVHLADGSNPGTCTLSGGGITTWTQMFDSYYDQTGTDQRCYLWRAQQATPSNGTVTIDPTNASVTHAAWSIVEFTGAHIDIAGNGAGAVVQAVRDPASDPATNTTSRTVTLSAFGLGSWAYAAMAANVSDVAIDGNMTSMHDLNQLSDSHVAYKSSEETSIAFTHSSGQSVLFGLEIKALIIANASQFQRPQELAWRL